MLILCNFGIMLPQIENQYCQLEQQHNKKNSIAFIDSPVLKKVSTANTQDALVQAMTVTVSKKKKKLIR